MYKLCLILGTVVLATTSVLAQSEENNGTYGRWGNGGGRGRHGFAGMGGRGGFNGFGGGRHGGPFGGFKSNLTDDQKAQLKTIFQNSENATKQQTQDSLRSFFESVGGEALTNFNAKQAEMEAKKAQFSNFTSQANLSDAAKNLLTQVQAVKDNMAITKAEERQQIKALFDGASDEVKAELHKGKGGRGGHGRGRFEGQNRGWGGPSGGFGNMNGFGGPAGNFGGRGGWGPRRNSTDAPVITA